MLSPFQRQSQGDLPLSHGVKASPPILSSSLMRPCQACKSHCRGRGHRPKARSTELAVMGPKPGPGSVFRSLKLARAIPTHPVIKKCDAATHACSMHSLHHNTHLPLHLHRHANTHIHRHTHIHRRVRLRSNIHT